MVNFPTSLDDFTNPNATDKLNSPSHSVQHTNKNDAIEAIEAKVGVNSSAVTTSQDYLLTNTASDLPGHTHSTYVTISGARTIYQVKTFDSFPVTPSSAPTTNYQVANKKYVDDQVATADQASEISIADAGDYYTGTDVEAALQEIGAGTTLNSKYLQITNNLSDVASAATARTNLGLVAGGAGDIWVEKAGDTMTGALLIQNTADSTTAFQVNQADTTNVLTVDTTNARVGIGTAAPVAEIHIAKDNTTANLRVIAHSDTPAQAGRLLLGHTRGTAASPTATQNGDSLGLIFAGGWDTNDTFREVIGFYADGEWGTASDASDSPTRIVFKTTPNTSSNPAERMRIDSSGKVGIGTTSPSAVLETNAVGAADVFKLSRSADSVYTVFSHGNYGSGSGALYIEQSGTISTLNFFGSSAIERFVMQSSLENFVIGPQAYSSVLSGIVRSTNASTADTGGSNLIFNAGRGKGTGAGGYFSIGTSPVGDSGTTLNVIVERMRIDTTGRVGINQTSPGAMLQIDSNGAAVIGQIIKGTPSQSANLTEWQDSNASVIANMQASGRMIANQFLAQDRSELTSGLFSSIKADLSVNNQSASTASFTGFEGDLNFLATAGGDVVAINGFTAGVASQSTYDITSTLRGAHFWTRIDSTGGATNTYALTLGNYRGGSGTGTVVNNYGLHIADITGATTLNYAIYTNAGTVHFGDNVGIGVTDPDTKLEILHAGNQLKLSYDGTDNAVFAVDTAGDLTITPSGTSIIIPSKLAFTQADLNEYIDSLNDGYLDIGATTAIRMNADLSMGTAGDVLIGSGSAKIGAFGDVDDRLAFDGGGQPIQWANVTEWYFPPTTYGQPFTIEIEFWNEETSTLKIVNDAGGIAKANLDVQDDIIAGGNILPAVDSASNLGSSTPLYFANAYIDRVYFLSTVYLDGATGDLDLFTPAQKTLELQTPVYKDINMAGYLLTKPTSSAPGVDTFRSTGGANTTIETYAFANDEKVHGGFELQHDYKEGTNLTFHVHWQGIAVPSGTDNVQWRINYIVARDGVTLAAATVIDSPDTAIDTQYRCYRNDFGEIDGTNFLIGDQFMFTLTRVASTGDEYLGEALIETAGIHYQVVRLGSRQITIA